MGTTRLIYTTNLLAWRLARRELRGGIKSRFRGFRIFLACLALGTAAIAAVGSISSAIETGLGTEARALLGGDVELRIHHRPATDEQRQWLAARGELSEIIEVRAMARHSGGGKQRLVELKAVDSLYPLVGQLEIQDGQTLSAALAPDGGLDGAVVAENLLERLGLSVGDRIAIADNPFFNGDILRFTTTGTLPGNLPLATDTFVVGRDDAGIQASLTKGGAAIDLLDGGAGTHTATRQIPPFVSNVPPAFTVNTPVCTLVLESVTDPASTVT